MTGRDGRFPDVTGVILAGGESNRMGSDKALLTIDGVSFLNRIRETLSGVVGDVVISAREEQDYTVPRSRVIGDVYKNCGPLAGIHAALSAIPTPRALVVSCDLPLITPEACRRLLTADVPDDVVVARSEGRLQPLFGLYHKKILPALERYLRQDRYSVLDFLNGVDVTVVDLGPSAGLMNVNTPGEYADILSAASRYFTTAPSPLS